MSGNKDAVVSVLLTGQVAVSKPRAIAGQVLAINNKQFIYMNLSKPESVVTCVLYGGLCGNKRIIHSFELILNNCVYKYAVSIVQMLKDNLKQLSVCT